VVGEITALIAMAKPRPRLTVPVPLSNGLDHSLQHLVHHLLDRRVLQDLSGRMRAALMHDVFPAELHRVHVQRAGHHVGVAFVGPHQLRHAEAA
jgi:hypothetical protein